MYKGITQAKLRSKCKQDSQESEYDRVLFMRITYFPYVSTAMRHCSILIVIMEHSKTYFQF